MAEREPDDADVVLVGAGIMSMTLATFLKELQPHLRLEIIERLPGEAQESSAAWNNAGTGHAANCELNYTPQRPDGSVDIAKALEVNVEFDMSRQFWSYLVRKGAIPSADAFIHPVPHMSFITGADRVAFLKKRHATMSAHHCYRGMEYSEDHKQIAEWVPLIMEGRDPAQPVAATRMVTGADVNYGALTSALLAYLRRQGGFDIHFNHEVTDLHRRSDGGWQVDVTDEKTGEKRRIGAKYVFLGAGGAAVLGAAARGQCTGCAGQHLRGAPGLVDAQARGERPLADLGRTGRHTGALHAGHGLHAPGAAADQRAPLRRLLGLPA